MKRLLFLMLFAGACKPDVLLGSRTGSNTSNDASPGADAPNPPNSTNPWMPLNSGTATDLYGVSGSSPSDVYAVGGTPGMASGSSGVILHWNGNTWSISTHSVNLLAVSVYGSVAAVGEYGGMGSDRFSGDNGVNWRTSFMNVGPPMHAVWLMPFGIYVAGESGTINYSTEPGVPGSWGGLTTGATNTIYSLWGLSPGNVYAVGAGGTILSATSATVSNPTGAWSKVTSPFDGNLRSVWGSSTNDVYVGGEGGGRSIVLHTTDGGTTWTLTDLTAISGGSTTGTFAIGGRSATDIYAVGKGDIYHSAGNDIWTVEKNPTAQDLYGVWVASTGDVFAVGRAGTILHK